MNPVAELNLSLILFLPWFLILGALFWFFPRQPRGFVRRGYDLAALVLSLVASWYAMRWGFVNADPGAGAIWKQVLATLTAYGAFLALIGVAWWLRGKLVPRNPA